MEGDSAKGVLTIRQTLDTNEVVIAVENVQRDQAARGLTKPRLAAVKPLHPQKTSVYTNTDHLRATTTERHVQICDDRYTSCYQVAHCSFSPTSPPVPISEFPPQRANPIYNEGNFEIGGYGSWQARGPCRANHFRGGLTWPDRGSVHCNQSSRDVDAFAHSLRKYPSCSPDRSVSSELVARLLRYTQAKYAQKTARTKSMRSLPNDKSSDRHAARKRSRYLQTSARPLENLSTRRVDSTKREETKREVSPRPTRVIKRDRGTNSENVEQRDTRKYWRNYRLRSPVSERNVNRNESNFSTKYDYLKAGQTREVQGSEQLSIDEISRQLQSVIRQFYNPRPVVFQVCPRIQKRYIQHKKTCPVKNSATWMTDEADEEQASSSKLCRFLESINIMAGEPSDTDLDSSVLSEQLSYCHCTQSPQCHCEPKPDDKSNDKSTQSEVICKQGEEVCTESCECLPFTNEAYYRNRIDEEIAKWFNEIPVQNNERSDDKKRRENLVKTLTETLKQLPDDEDFDTNVKKAIEQCVDEMPMWYPGTKKDEEQMKNQLIEKLLSRITKIPRKADKLRDAVKNFINSLNFTGDEDKKAITDNFVKKLKLLAFNVPKDGDEFEDLLIFEVTEMLDKLPLQFRGIKSVVLNTLANKLADDVKDLLKSTDLLAGEDSLKYTFKEIISKWFEEVGEVSKELPNSDEVENIINKLAVALDDLQSQGIDDITMNKMEREISKILETLDIPVKISDELTNNLMDKVTDIVYARDKNKLDTFQKQETFKELNNWLNNLQGVDDLSPVEKYKLVKEIADIVEDTKDEESKYYQVDILEKLDRLHINIDPDSLGMQIDEIKDKLKSLPEKVKKDDLIANMQKDFNDVIDKSDTSENKKTNLKDKADNIIAKNIEASSLATKRDIDDMKEMLLDQIYDPIEHLPDNVQIDLENKLNVLLDNYIDKMQSAKDKDTAKYALLKEINYIIDKEHIPEEENNDIKYKIKHILEENLDQPFSDQVKDTIMYNIGNIVDDAQIETDQKDNLINKLMNTVDKTLAQLPKQSIKDHVRNKTIRNINKVIDKSQIPDNARDNIKQKLKNKILSNFDQPFSADIRDIILQDINETIDDAVLPRSFKDDLKRKLTDVVAANLDEMPEQTTVDYTKESLVHDINDFLDDIPLPKEQLNDLKKKIKFTFAEFLDRPYTHDRRDKLNETFENIIAESDIPSDEKDTILEKLIHITGKKLDQLPYQTPEEYAKETILRDIMHMLSDLPLTTSEKKDLISQFEDLIEESLRQGYLGEGREGIKEGIINIIRDSSAPQPQQDELIFKTLHAVSKILDESYYEDYVRDELEDFYDLINKAPMHTAQKNILKPKTKRIVDDHTLDSEFGIVKDMIKDAIHLIQEPSDMSLSEQESNIAIDETIIDDIINAIWASSLPNNKKSSLEYKVNTLVEELKDAEDLDRIIRELQKIVSELPLPLHDQKVLKYRLAMVVSREKGKLNEPLKYELIKGLESAVDLISLGKKKNIDLKSTIKDFVTTLDEPMSGNIKDKIQDGIFKILDKAVYSADKKHQLRDRITSIIDKLPTEPHEKIKINERLLSHIGDIVEETPIRQHIKKNIKAQIGHIISENSKQPYKKKTNERMKTDIANIINAAPITEYQKRTLNSKINKILDQLTHTNGNKNTLIGNINSILDDEPLSKVKKSELKKKMYGQLSDFDETTSYEEKNKIIKSILKIIDDTVMPKDNKANLKDKLENILTKHSEALPSSSDPEKNLLTALDNSVSKVLDDALIPQYTKTYLKKRMKNALPQILQQPMSSDIEESISEAISKIMDDVALSKAEKDIIKNKLVSTVFEKLIKPWPKSEKHVVEDVMKPVPPYDHTINDATSDIKATVMDKIISVFDELKISTVGKEKLKHQLKGIEDKPLRTPQNNDTTQFVKDDMHDIVNEAPIPRDKKSNLKNKPSDMIDNNATFLPDRTGYRNKSYKPDVDVMIAITDEIDSMLGTLQMNKHQKDNLKQQVKDMLNKTLEQPINDDTIQVIKNTVNDIISEAPIPREKKNEFKRQLSHMIDTKVGSIPDKSIRVDRGEPSMKLKIDSKDYEIDHSRKKDAREEIDLVVGQLQIPNELKILLKQKLIDKAEQDFKTRRKSSALPHRLKEDNNIFKPVAKVKEEDTEEMKAILDQIQIKKPHKINLKKQVKVMTDENFKKPIDSDTLRIMKTNINNLIAEAPIQRDKKIDIKKLTSDMVESKEELLPGKNINYKTKPVPEVKAAIMKGIDTIVKQLDMNKNQKDYFKRQFNDTLAETLEEPINSDKLRVIKTRINDIIFEAPIPRDKKAEIRKEIFDMVDRNVEYPSDKSIKYKNKRVSDVKAAVTADIDSIFNQLRINKNQKDNLKHQLNDMVAENLEKPIDSHTMKVINNRINDIISEAPIPRDMKADIRRKISNVVDNRVESLPDKSFGYKEKRVSEVNAAVTKDIDFIVNQLDINRYQKDNLKHQLNDMVNENLQKPIDDDTLRVTKKRINDIISDAPIPIGKKAELRKKIADLVENRVESIPDKSFSYKDKQVSAVKAAIREDIDSTVNQLDINKHQKDNIKYQLNDMVAENLEKPIDDDTLRYIKKRINDIISKAPISREKKAEIRGKLSQMVDNRVESLPDKNISYKNKQTSEMKAAVTKDIDSIVNQLDINRNQKDNLKHQLNDMVAENLEKPIDDDTLRDIKKRINDIISKAPISREKKADIRGKLSQMVDNRVESPPDKNISYKNKQTSEMKAAVTKDIDSIVNQLDINRNQKDNLKHQLNDTVAETLGKPIDDDTLRDIKKRINDIISDAPIPRERKAELRKKIADMVENRVVSLPDKTIKYKNKGVSAVKAAVTKDIDSIVNQLDINRNQKDNLKHQLNDMADENLQKPIDDDTLRDTKKRINAIISAAPIPIEKKAELRKKIADMVENRVEFLPDKSFSYKDKQVSEVNAAVTKDIDFIVNQLDINRNQKDNLKHQLNDMVNVNLEKPIDDNTLRDIKKRINDTISDAPIPREKKAELKKKISDMVENRVVSLPDKSIKYKNKRVSEVKAAVTKDKDSIVNQLDINRNPKDNLKHQLKDMVDENLQTPIDDDTLRVTKKRINDIISDAPIPIEKKAELRKKTADMVDNRVESLPNKSFNYKDKQVSTVKAAVTEDIDSIVNQLDINKNQKDSMKYQLNDMVAENLEKPIDDDTLRDIKKRINNIISKAPISREKKAEISGKLSQMVDNRVESLPNKNINYKNKRVSEVKAAVTKDKDSIVNQLDINRNPKDNLKHQLNDMVDENLQTHINDDTLRVTKKRINYINSDAPIPIEKKAELRKKTANVVENRVESLPDKSFSYKDKRVSAVKAAVTEDIDSIVNQLDISKNQKDNMKHQLNDMVVENLEKPIDDDTLRDIKKRINDIISKAPISREKKAEISGKLSQMVDNRVECLPNKNINYKNKRVSEVKAAVTKDIDSVVNQQDINRNPKDNLKHQLNDMVDENLQTPIDDDTLRVTKKRINYIISDAPIPIEKKAELRKKTANMVENRVESKPDKSFSYKDKRVSAVKAAVTEDIDSIINQLDISKNQKDNMKHQLNDMVAENLEKPIDDDTLRDIKKRINDIISKAPISRENKAEISGKLSQMVDKRVESLPDKRISYKDKRATEVKAAVTKDIESIVNPLDINKNLKDNLKHQLNEMVNEDLQKPIDDDTLRNIKKRINDIISDAPIPRENKSELRKKIADMVENRVESLPDKSFGYKDKRVSEVNAAVTKDIDSIVNQLDINRNQKDNLKHQLNDMVNENLQKPIDDYTLRDIIKNINDIIFDAPIPREQKAELKKKLADMVENRVESMRDKSFGYKDKRVSEVKAAVTKDIDSIVNQLDINRNQKDNLKHQLNDMVNENLQKPIDDDTLRVTKKRINDIISNAPIPIEKKAELRKKIADMVENRVESKPDKSFSYKDKRVSAVNAAVTEDIDSIVNQLDINKNQKDNIKHQLNDMVAENLENPIDDDTLRDIKKRINDIISKAPISIEKKAEISGKLSQMVDNRVESLLDKSISYKDKRAAEVRAAVTKDIESIVNPLDINKNLKDNLKHQLNVIVNEDLQKPIDDDILRNIKKRINDIISNAPIPRENKSELRKKIADMVENRVESLPDKSFGYKDKRVSEVNAAVTKDIDSIINQLDINRSQKDNLKHQLNDMVNENLQKPIDDYRLREIKKKINDIIFDAPIPREQKTELKKKIGDVVENRAESMPDKSFSYKDKRVSAVKAAVTEDIDSIVNQLDINKNQKDNIKHQLNDMVAENLEKPIDDDTIRDIKKRINDIISKAPISIEKKAELSGKLSQMVDNRVESLPDKNISYKNKRTSEVKAAVTKDIDSIVNQLDINRNQKDNLKHQLNDTVAKTLGKPIDDDTLRDIKKIINDIISDAPIPREKKAELRKKIADMVENRVVSLPDKSIKYKNKRGSAIKAAVTKDIDSIFNQLDINRNQKDNLKHQLNDIVNENFQKPTDDYTLGDIKKRINDTISDAPIPREKKTELRKQIADMVENRVEYLPDNSFSYKDKRASETKAAVTKDIDSIVNQLDINKNQKDNLKHQLNEIVNENLQKPIDDDTLRNTKKRINDIISEAPIPRDMKAEMRNKISDLIASKVEYLPKESINYKTKRVSKVKAAVTDDIDSILNQLDINKTQKDILKHQLNDMVTENLDKPITSDTVKVMKNGISDIIANAPISRDIKNNLRKILSNILDDRVESSPAKIIGIDSRKLLKNTSRDFEKSAPKFISPSERNNIMQEVDSTLDQIQLPNDQKIVLKQKLKNKIDDNLRDPLLADTLNLIKADINNIIAEAPMSKEKKAEIRDKMSNMVDNENIMQGIDSETFMDSKTKSKRKADFIRPDRSYGSNGKRGIKPETVVIEDDAKRNITELSTDRYKKTKVSVLRYEKPGTSSRRSRLSRPQKQDRATSVTYDADDEETKDDMPVRISTKRKVIDHGVSHDEDMENEEDESGTNNTIADHFGGILNELTMSKQMKKYLEGQLAEVLNKKRDSDDGRHNVMLRKTGSLITKLPVEKHVKEDFLHKLVEMSKPLEQPDSEADTDDSKNESDMSPTETRSIQQGLIASTPKKGRKSWEESDTFSVIDDDDFMSPEVRNYWQDIENSINDWLDALPIYLDDETMAAIKEGIANDIRERQRYLRLNPDQMLPISEELENLQYKILRRLSKVLDEDDMRIVMAAAGDLMTSMKAVEVPRAMTALAEDSDILDWLSPEKLQNIVNQWIDNLPLDPSIRNSSKFQTLKQDLVSNIVDKLDEMNNDPAIFHDDELYDEMLMDEIGKLINELPIDPEMITDEAEALFNQLKALHHKARAENASMAYKQQLEEAISATLPLEDPSPEELAAYELMKGEVADAFISLHYSGGNEEQRNLLKKKIFDEVNKYCDDYLKKHPGEPLDREKLAEDLYKALKNVSMPPDESMRLAEEQIRLKDIVNKWVKELPLAELTAEERLQLTRKVDKLAKSLKDIERNDAQLSDSEVNNAMQRQITKFLNKAPLKPGEEKNIGNFTTKLIARIRATEQARSVDDSTIYSITADDTLLSGMDMDNICPYYKSLLEKQRQLPVRRKSQIRVYPPCSLSKEDREHLERIRQRTCMTPDCLSSLLRGKRNSYVNPMSTESESQTEQNLQVVGRRISTQPCSAYGKSSPRPCPGVPPAVAKQINPSQLRNRFVESGSQVNVQPQIIIKEYYWDTVDSSEIPPPELRHSPGSMRRRYTVPSSQPSPAPDIRPQQPTRRSPSKTFQPCQDEESGASLPCTSSPYITRPYPSRHTLPYTSSPCDPGPCPPKPSSPKPCVSRPCVSRPCTPRPRSPRPHSIRPCATRPCDAPPSQSFIPHQRPYQQNSDGPFYRDYEYKGPKRDGLQPEYPEQSSSRYSRKERVIELGSLDDLRSPCQRKRTDDYGWTSHFPDDDFWETQQSSHEVEDDSEVTCPYVRERKEERLRCKCKEKVLVNNLRRRPRQQCPKHSNNWSNYNENNIKRCSRCTGSHCPYPSYMYFSQQ